MFQFFFKNPGRTPHAALFLSGTGTNAEHLLSSLTRTPHPLWTPSVIVTDRPDSSAARRLASKFSIPLVEHDIKTFYREHGLATTSISAPDGMRVRELWTDALRRKIAPYHIDFGLLAGFVPLSNIVTDFPCLNVHPGDLTVEENGIRVLAGLHRLPVENALLRGNPTLRSSVIVVQPFDGASTVDAGPILGVSAPVPVEWGDCTPEQLRAVAAKRAGQPREVVAGDPLARLASDNLENLKCNGDWVVFPPVVNDFAAGHFACDESGLVYLGQGNPMPVRTVEYAPDGTARPIPR